MENKTKEYPCPNCQGGGCELCGGAGILISTEPENEDYD